MRSPQRDTAVTEVALFVIYFPVSAEPDAENRTVDGVLLEIEVPARASREVEPQSQGRYGPEHATRMQGPAMMGVVQVAEGRVGTDGKARVLDWQRPRCRLFGCGRDMSKESLFDHWHCGTGRKQRL